MTKHILTGTLLLLFCNSLSWGEALQNQQDLQDPGWKPVGTTTTQSSTQISSSTGEVDTTTIEEARYTLRTTVTRVESPSMPWELYMDVEPTNYLQTTFYNVSGPFNYTAGGEHYMFWPGTVTWFRNPQPTSREDIHPAPSFILKRIDGVWKFWKEVPEVMMWGPRNYKVTDEWVVIGDGNELGQNEYNTDEGNWVGRWQGDTFYGEFLPNGDIDWVRVNSQDEMAYFHGTSGGDVNGDGLIDVGGAPQWDFDTNSGVILFLQNQDGSFSKSDSLINYPEDYWSPFSVEFADVVGDEKAEIITADYGTPYDESKQNHVMVFKYEENTELFELHFVSEEPRAFYEVDMAATSIQAFDFTGDGILDLSVAREGGGNSFEIWKGNGDGTFDAHWSTPIWSDDELQLREFWVFDVNGDDALDIVLRPFHYGSFYRNNPVWWNVYVNNGIKLHKLIWLNNGDGTFDHYDGDELKIEGLMVDNVYPYMDGETLHFMGTYTFDDGLLYGEKALNLTTYDIELKLNFEQLSGTALYAPSNNSKEVGVQTTLQWEVDANAEAYDLQVSSDGFESFVIDEEVSDTSYTTPTLAYNTNYSWRVRSTNSTGDSEWSDVWTFTILGQPLSPSIPEVPHNGQDNVGTLTEFHWSDVDSARGYQLQVSTDSTFTTQMIQSAELDSSTYTLSDPIRENTQYFWRVRALAEVEALHAEWSDTLSFTTGVRTSVEEAIPTSYSLDQNFPNPFNPTTSITYSLPQSAVVSLKIYDITGKYITTLVDGVNSAGIHTVTFDAGSLSSGMYVYTLETDGFRQSKQMMLVK